MMMTDTILPSRGIQYESLRGVVVAPDCGPVPRTALPAPQLSVWAGSVFPEGVDNAGSKINRQMTSRGFERADVVRSGA